MTGAVNGIAPTAAAHLTRKDYVDNMAARVGHGFHYIGGTLPSRYLNTDFPSEALFLNGRAVSRSVFSALFAEFSTFFGAGDGVSTFNLPNTMGYFVRNLNNTGSGVDAGRGVPGSIQQDSIEEHTHGTPATFNAASGATPIPGGTLTGAVPNLTGTGETRPVNMAFWHCVYTGLPRP